jgi:hypothetical protein
MTRSTLDPDILPAGPAVPGHDVRSIGPSDSSDSGSDLAGTGLLDDDAAASVGDLGMDDTSDRNGTGERITADTEPNVRLGADIGFDRIIGADEAGLGGGLDQAEEAQLGITDEEIERRLQDDLDP